MGRVTWESPPSLSQLGRRPHRIRAGRLTGATAPRLCRVVPGQWQSWGPAWRQRAGWAGGATGGAQAKGRGRAVSWLGLFPSLPFAADFRLNLGNCSLLSTISFLHSWRGKHPRTSRGEETLSDSAQLLPAPAGGRAARIALQGQADFLPREKPVLPHPHGPLEPGLMARVPRPWPVSTSTVCAPPSPQPAGQAHRLRVARVDTRPAGGRLPWGLVLGAGRVGLAAQRGPGHTLRGTDLAGGLPTATATHSAALPSRTPGTTSSEATEAQSPAGLHLPKVCRTPEQTV